MRAFFLEPDWMILVWFLLVLGLLCVAPVHGTGIGVQVSESKIERWTCPDAKGHEITLERTTLVIENKTDALPELSAFMPPQVWLLLEQVAQLSTRAFNAAKFMGTPATPEDFFRHLANELSWPYRTFEFSFVVARDSVGALLGAVFFSPRELMLDYVDAYQISLTEGQLKTIVFPSELCVHPSAQGRGIGTLLLFSDKQAQAILLWIDLANMRARSFYKKHGFIELDQYVESYPDDEGQFMPCLWKRHG